MRRLLEAATKPLAVVTAPAGFGKSTLLRAFAARESAVLIDLSSGEATFRDAVRLMCEALREVAPGARLAFASAYARAAERGQRTSSLARWLARYLEDAHVTIVVDSVDRLGAETRAFAEFAEALARHGAHGPHVVLGARDDTDLPIPRWFADDVIAMPVGADDLRWTVAQARAAARQLGTPHDEQALRRIAGAANGRAFDVVYALHTGATPPPGEDPGATLLRSLAPDERAYVLETCLLHVLDEPVLAAAGLGPHPLLAAGSRLGELVVHPHAPGYRYDDSLRVCAEATLREDPAEYHRVAQRSVTALEAVGSTREAVRLACAARLHERVRRLLSEHGLQLEDRGDTDTVDAALDLLPDDERGAADDAVVTLLRAMRESRQGRTDTSEAWFRHAIARAQSGAESRAVSAEAAYRLAREIVRRDRSDAVELLEPYAHDRTLDVAQRSAILSALAEAYLVARRPEDSRSALVAALAHVAELDVAARAHLYTRASYVELYAGDRAQAHEYALTGAALAEEAHLYVMALGSYSVLYNVAYAEAGPSESLVYLERLAECAIRSGNVDFHLYAIIAAYEMQVERGESDAIERLERDLREFDLYYGTAPALQGLLSSRALLAAWTGGFTPAYEMLSPTGTQQTDADCAALRWAEIALYAAAAGMAPAARDALRTFAEAFARDGGSSQIALRGSILARLAASLAGTTPEPAVAFAAAGRIGALSRAVDVVIARREGAACPEAFLDALDDLRRHELAGLARLFAALPVAAA